MPSRGDEYIALYVTARTVLLEDVFDEIRGREPHLTDHGPRHIADVLSNVFKLLDGNLDHFTPLEHYILGLSVLFHDVGNLHGRQGHNTRIGHFYDHVRRDAPRFGHERTLVVQIAQAHTGLARNGSRNTLTDVPELLHLDGEPIKAREIAAVVRFADELAEGRQRTSAYMTQHGLHPPENADYHRYSQATDIAIDKGNARIAITYHLDIDTKTAVDEETSKVRTFLTFACTRLAKMDLERRYARFHCVKPLSAFKQISARLNIQIDEDIVEPGLHAIISDDVNLDARPDLLCERDEMWDPDVVADRVRNQVTQRVEHG